MANIQVKNVPAALHRQLQRLARKQGCTLSDLVRTALERELARHAFLERLAQRQPPDLDVSAASLLTEERQQRNQELS